MRGAVSKQMRLTARHVAELAREMPDPGFNAVPGYRAATTPTVTRSSPTS
jgi:hypothetical protein